MSEQVTTSARAPERIVPTALPALPLAARAGLPECAAIYFVIADDGEILYVGRAITLRSRWTAHHRRAELEALGAVSIAWLEVSDAAVLPAIEAACREHFAPRLNGTRVPENTFLRWAAGMLRNFYHIPPDQVAIRQSPVAKKRTIYVMVNGSERAIRNDEDLHGVVKELEAMRREQHEEQP